MVDQIVDIVEMVVRRLHRLAQRAAVGGLAVDDALLHPLEQQRARHLVKEILVEPRDQTADLGTLRGGAVDHRLALDRLLEIFGDRIAVDQHLPATLVDHHRGAAGGVEVDELVAPLPRRLAQQFIADPLFAQQKPDLAGKGTKRKLIELPHGFDIAAAGRNGYGGFQRRAASRSRSHWAARSRAMSLRTGA